MKVHERSQIAEQATRLTTVSDRTCSKELDKDAKAHEKSRRLKGVSLIGRLAIKCKQLVGVYTPRIEIRTKMQASECPYREELFASVQLN